MLAENLPCMSQNVCVCVASFDYEADLPTWEGRVHVVIESERIELSLGGSKGKRRRVDCRVEISSDDGTSESGIHRHRRTTYEADSAAIKPVIWPNTERAVTRPEVRPPHTAFLPFLPSSPNGCSSNTGTNNETKVISS